MKPIAPALAESPARATRVRYRVVALVMGLGMVTYVDRVCISSLAPAITAEFGLTKVQMGYVFSAFALAYAAFEIPTGWLADRRGTRITAARIVVWWSAFTAATGATAGYASLLVTRFLFGAGEAGAWPCMARTFSRWIPRTERGTVQGMFFAGVHLAGGLTPLLVAALLAVMPWRAIFVCFGLLGLVWTAVWLWWFRDEPDQHPEVNRAELDYIAAGREAAVHHSGWAYWKTLLGNRNLLAVCLMYFPNSFVFYFCITWLPSYLREQHGFTAAKLTFFAGLPLLLSVVGDLLGGIVTDRVTARFGPRWGRCGVGGLAYLLAGVALLATPLSPSPMVAATLIAVAVAASMFVLAPAWGTCIDLAGNHAAVVGAAMNTAGQLGSLLCPLMVAYALKWYGSWNVSIYLMGALFLLGAACWWVIDPRQRIFRVPAPV